MQYQKITVLERFLKAWPKGFTVKDYTGDTRKTLDSLYYKENSYKQIEKLFRRYWLQYLLSRMKEGSAYRYFLTSRGKERLEYLQKREKENEGKDKSPA